MAFVNSPEGCEIQNTVNTVTGPYVTKACSCPTTSRRWSRTCRRTSTTASRRPALEFVSPIKGPNLERITVEVGSGIKSAEEGAKLYDEDVKKQAQQLGLDGW